MSTFSQRYGYKSSVLQLETASDTLKRRILAAFYKQEFDSYDTIDWTNYTTGIEDMMIEMGVPYEFPKNELIKKRNAEALQKYIMDAKEWYVIFDFIERYFMNSEEDTVEKMRTVFNRILEEEVSGYRIMDKLVVPIVSEHELKALEEAISIPYDSARTHIRKAVDSFSNRKAPDYENTIEYLDITPQEFFNDSLSAPKQSKAFLEAIDRLGCSKREHVLQLVTDLLE